MTAIAVIPARAGSKRIEDKNIKIFCGRPIIEWVIETALRSQLFKRVIVTTDSEKIAYISKAMGAEIPFLRPEALSDDKAGLQQVVNHSIEFLEKTDPNFEFVTLLYSTAPFITVENISRSLEELKNNDF